MRRWRRALAMAIAIAVISMIAIPALAEPAADTDYRQILGLDSRTIVWVVAQLHLLFGAIVLGVPMFAVIVELVGYLGGEERYDWLAKEFTKLLSAAFSTTAALGGMLAFLLIGLYPRFMHVLGNAVHMSFYVYAAMFFFEAFALYLYYYGWDRMKSRAANLARAKKPAWIASGLLAAAIVGLMLFHGEDIHAIRAEGEHSAAEITEVAAAVKAELEAALKKKRKKIGVRTNEAVWRERVEAAVAARETESAKLAGDKLLPIVIETLKSKKADRIVAAFSREAELIAVDAKLEAFNRGSDASAEHWQLIALFGLVFLMVLGFASWASSWKAFHLYLGLVLNIVGTSIMMIANSWATFMMSPTGVNTVTSEFGGTAWGAVNNPLWNPVNMHRILANVVFGGFVAGTYAAVRFLGSDSDQRRALYDWMGYIGNFVGMIAMIPLPFAGYYLGREIYSFSPIMGNNMMGGAFSWAFIFQALLIGMLFIGANYYLWVGMERIPGAERYRKLTPWYSVFLIFSFAVWLTPHNLPLSGAERALMGGVQYHPLLKYLGLMPAKNAVVNLIILTTFFCFLMYRRANKGETKPFSAHGVVGKIVVGGALVAVLSIMFWYAWDVLSIDLEAMSVAADKRWVMTVTAGTLFVQMAMAIVAVLLTFMNRGKIGQVLLFASTALIVTGFHGVWGFVTMLNANPFLRNIAVAQVLMVLCTMILNGAIDVFLFRGAKLIGGIRWGKIPARSQYALVLVTVAVVQLMCLMGFIRSGLREDWHIYGMMRDTSAGADTPTLATMSWVVGGITLTFFALVAFVFWLGSLGDKKDQKLPTIEMGDAPGPEPTKAEPKKAKATKAEPKKAAAGDDDGSTDEEERT